MPGGELKGTLARVTGGGSGIGLAGAISPTWNRFYAGGFETQKG